MNELSADGLSALAGILLSLGCNYLPGVRQRFAELDSTGKRLVMLGLLAISALGVFGLSCTPYQPFPGLSCDQTGAWGLLRLFLAAMVANQAAFTLSPRLSGKKTRLTQQMKRHITRRRRSPVEATFTPANPSSVQAENPAEGASPNELAPAEGARPDQGTTFPGGEANSEAGKPAEGS